MLLSVSFKLSGKDEATAHIPQTIEGPFLWSETFHFALIWHEVVLTNKICITETGSNEQ